ANGALISAKFGGSQAAIDAGLVAQIELNAKVLGNPDGYLPKADIPKPSVEKTTIPQKFTNWWDETFTKPINNLLPTSKNDEVEVVVSKLNKLMDRVYPESPNLPECRAGLCGWVSDDVEIAFKYNDFKTTQYQVADLNIARGIPSPETNSFKHAITIVEDDKGNKYLIDLTFSQFINKETGIIQHPTTKINTNFTIDNPLAKEIFEKGYIKLDDNTLNEYLNLMTSSDVPQPKVGLDILDQTKTRREVRKSTPDEIEKYYPELVNKKEAPPPPLTGFAKVQEQIKNIFGGKGTNFGDDALLTVGGGTYKSLGGQKLVIDPSRDTSLQQYLITAKDYIV
ncbi:MAG: hypothetical protein Q8P20_03330, partial [bacterium]|nr:hypothetical protein [bacterium]